MLLKGQGKMKIKTSRNIRILILVNFLYGMGIYITLPVLALHFNLDFGLSFIQVGILLGTPPIISACLGFMGASVSQKLGIVNSLIMGLLLLVVPYLCYAYVEHFIILFLVCLLQGLSRIFWEPVIKYLYTFHAKESDCQDIIFRMKYCAVCLGAIIGPFIAGLLSAQGKVNCLLASIIVFSMLAIGIFMNRRSLDGTGEQHLQEKIRNFRDLKNCDRQLLFYILANTFVFFVFTQFETIFSLALKDFSDNPERLFTCLLLLNAIAGILLQLIFLFIAGKMKTIYYILLGNIAFAVSFGLFACSRGEIVLLAAATVIFTLGEVVVIPGGDIIIDEIAPEQKKTLYFGFAEFRLLGFSLGPVFASIILEYFGSAIMFWSSTIIILLANILYYWPHFLANRKTLIANRI